MTHNLHLDEERLLEGPPGHQPLPWLRGRVLKVWTEVMAEERRHTASSVHTGEDTGSESWRGGRSRQRLDCHGPSITVLWRICQFIWSGLAHVGSS